METQLSSARRGTVTPQMEQVARSERVQPARVRESIARGHAVLPCNPAHAPGSLSLVGRDYRTKINANLGRSADLSCARDEVEKLKIATACGAHFVMDLSVGPDLADMRRAMLENCAVPLGTVPIYEALARADGRIENLTEDLLLTVIGEHARQGVDFMTLHAGLLRGHIAAAMQRKMGIVSRGGAIMAEWMQKNDAENPLYTHWDAVLDILLKHDVTVSLGDGLRPGCLADASDAAQFSELDVLGELVNRCRARGVQVMVEGPGHIPFNQIQMNMERQQQVCDGAPFYVLGPVVTDIAPGYDHITSCIGATAAATYGASLLCYVTPAEHLGLPDEEEVHQGVIAYRIAAHAGDIARGLPGARDIDDRMAQARVDFDWEKQFECAMDPARARARWLKTRSCDETVHTDDHCSMCGKEFCAVRTSKRIRENGK